VSKNEGVPSSDTQQRRRALLQAAKTVIHARYRDPDLALEDVAGELDVSRRQLQRVFREQAGTDFPAYLLGYRMRRAARLLSRERNPLPVRAVAPLVGYRGPSGLRQAFKRYYGRNPSEVQPPPPDYDILWRAEERR
jgi:AraC-like DNA-binding protein